MTSSFHVHAFNWNESKLLPAFLKHYEQADKIYIYDNESTDNSVDIILAAGRDVISFSSDGKFDDTIHQNMRNEMWKKSIGKTDYVIIQDLDEFLHFPKDPNNLKAGISKLYQKGVTLIYCIAYTIVCKDGEWDNILINNTVHPTLQISTGFLGDGFTNSSHFYDKCIIFNPNKITDTNYQVGGHILHPTGILESGGYQIERPLLLHFKHIDLEYEYNRRVIFRDRLSHQFGKGYSWQYNKTNDEIRASLLLFYNNPAMINIKPIILQNQRGEALIEYRPIVQYQPVFVDIYNSIDYISSHTKDGYIWEPLITAYISSVCKNNKVLFIDIGSNIGLHTFTAIISNAVRCYAFECNPETYKKIDTTIKANCLTGKIFPIKLAVSNESGKVFQQSSYNYNEGGAFLHTAENLQYRSGSVCVWDVQSIKMDDFNLNLQGIDKIVIKMDIEGHETEALYGMVNLLNNLLSTVVIIELNPTTSCFDRLMLNYNLLKSAGFTTVKLAFCHPPEPWASKIIGCLDNLKDITEQEIIEHLKLGRVLEAIFIK